MKTFPSKRFKAFGYLFVGLLFYIILLVIYPWNFSLTFVRLLEELAVVLLAVVLVMELIFFVNKKLDVYLPWRSFLYKRIIIQLVFQVTVVSIVIFLVKYLMPGMFVDAVSFRQSLVQGMIFCILLTTICTAGLFFIQWNKTAVEVVKYEKRVAKVELELLKMQINPHFLFNNFSTLTSLIEEDPVLAVEYVQQLCSIYRHALKDEEQHVVSLNIEMEFIRSYLFLYKTRFQESLTVRIDIPDVYMSKGIATATMQLIVENCLKHNSISRLKPLNIEIYAEENFIIVKNNINPMTKPVASSGIGLKNIVERYLLLSSKQISITHSDQFFIVKVPLLEK
jgi:hypothetical protein